MSKQRKGPSGEQNRTVIVRRRLPPPKNAVIRLSNGLYVGGPLRTTHNKLEARRYTWKEANRIRNSLAGLNWYPEATVERVA